MEIDILRLKIVWEYEKIGVKKLAFSEINAFNYLLNFDWYMFVGIKNGHFGKVL